MVWAPFLQRIRYQGHLRLMERLLPVRRPLTRLRLRNPIVRLAAGAPAKAGIKRMAPIPCITLQAARAIPAHLR